MDKQTYEAIMASLDERLTNCKIRFDRVAEAGSLDNLTVKELVELRKFCTDEYESMTKFAMVDLYHIIGMGNLAPQQMSKFAFKAQAYTSYRPDVKAIAERLDSLDNLPEIPTHTKFRLLTFRDIILYRGEPEDTCVEDTTDVEDYAHMRENTKTKANTVTETPAPQTVAQNNSQTVKTITTSFYTLQGVEVTVSIDKLPRFFKYIAAITNSTALSKTALSRACNKASSGGDCFGISWDGVFRINETVTGIVADKNTLTVLRSARAAEAIN